MGVFSDSQLQVFLSLYHGSLIGTFVYDYIIRNALYCFQDSPKWTYISNIVLGAVCVRTNTKLFNFLYAK